MTPHRTIIVSPAYGRDYKDGAAAKAAWLSGKDFVHETSVIFGGGTYCSSRDFGPNETIEIRYNRKMGHILLKGAAS